MSRIAQVARITAALAGLGVLAALPGRASADLFSFVDKDGTIHFTNKPSNDATARCKAGRRKGLINAAIPRTGRPISQTTSAKA